MGFRCDRVAGALASHREWQELELGSRSILTIAGAYWRRSSPRIVGRGLRPERNEGNSREAFPDRILAGGAETSSSHIIPLPALPMPWGKHVKRFHCHDALLGEQGQAADIPNTHTH